MTERSYDQWCGLALALDHLGDRWTLLVIRELLSGPRRYTDLRRNLPGIATNLLALRLKDLERDGIVERREFPPPTPATLYTLTPQGADLEPAVLTLTRWGSRLMPAAAPRAAERRPTWFALALRALLAPRVEELAVDVDATFLSTDAAPIRIRVSGATLTIEPGAEAPPSLLHISGNPGALLEVASGTTTLAMARRNGTLSVTGPRKAQAALASLLTRPTDDAA